MPVVRIWDLPTRSTHVLLVLCLLGLLITVELGGNWMVWHLRFGHAMGALLLFRLIWGLLGGHWSRFWHFAMGPSAWPRWRNPHPGHGPLGGLSVLAMLTLFGAQVLSGLMSDDAIAFYGPLAAHISSDWVELATDFHKSWGKWLILTWVCSHLVAVAVHQWVFHHSLISAMWHGDKHWPSPLPNSDDGHANRLHALFWLLIATALSWLLYRSI